jgi:hypothetical protein
LVPEPEEPEPEEPEPDEMDEMPLDPLNPGCGFGDGFEDPFQITWSGGEPGHNKEESDPAAARQSKETNIDRQAGIILTKAANIAHRRNTAHTAGLKTQEYYCNADGSESARQKKLKTGRIQHSAHTREQGKVVMDLLELHGGPTPVFGSRRARQIIIRADGCAGCRELWCNCEACAAGRYEDCLLKIFTGGEPRWVERCAPVVDVSPADLVEEMEHAVCSRLRVNAIVAVVFDGHYGELETLMFYLMRVKALPQKLPKGKKDDYKYQFKKGAVVGEGHFLELIDSSDDEDESDGDESEPEDVGAATGIRGFSRGPL